MQNGASQVLAVRYGFEYVKPKSLIFYVCFRYLQYNYISYIEPGSFNGLMSLRQM